MVDSNCYDPSLSSVFYRHFLRLKVPKGYSGTFATVGNLCALVISVRSRQPEREFPVLRRGPNLETSIRSTRITLLNFLLLTFLMATMNSSEKSRIPSPAAAGQLLATTHTLSARVLRVRQHRPVLYPRGIATDAITHALPCCCNQSQSFNHRIRTKAPTNFSLATKDMSFLVRFPNPS